MMKTTLVSERMEIEIYAPTKDGLKKAKDKVEKTLKQEGFFAQDGRATLLNMCNPVLNEYGEEIYEVPTSFAMYTGEGNEMMRSLAVRLKNALDTPNLGMVGKLTAILDYLRSYAGRDESGVHDTAVRDEVWDFVRVLGGIHNVPEVNINALWGEAGI